MIKVITTVGVSIFKENPDSILEDNGYGFWDKMKGYIADFKERINDNVLYNRDNAIKNSAEIKSILAIQKEVKEPIEVHLLSSHTILSRVAAELIRDFFDPEKNTTVDFDQKKDITVKFDPQNDVIEGIDVNKSTSFQEKGILNLIERIGELRVNKQKITQKNMILNITGGYKALLPILTLVGQLYKIPLYYIYEDSDELITIGNLPFSFDWVVVEAIGGYLDKIKHDQINLDSKNRNRNEIHKLLIDNFLIVKENNFLGLTALGQLLLKYLKDKTSMSSKVFGKFIEYKLFQHFQEEHTKFKYHSPQRYIPSWDDSIGDVDLILKDENDKTVICEVKSVYAAINLRENYHEKLNKRTKAYKDLKEEEVETLLMIIYEVQIVNSNNSPLTENEVLVTRLSTLRENITGVNAFKVIGIKLPLVKNQLKINYSSFLDKPLDNNSWEDVLPISKTT